MYSFTDLRLFLRIADVGSLSHAARDMDLSPAAASASLKRLEKQLGCRLLERNTRSTRVTPEGEVFLAYARNALSQLAEGEAALGGGSGVLRASLRLSAPSDFGRNVLLPWLNSFQAIHSNLSITLQCSDYRSDLVRDPVDMAFRYGVLNDSSLVSQYLAKNERIVVASPAYIKAHGCPLTPHDLLGHNCLLHNLYLARTNTWRFGTANGPVEVPVRGDRMADDGGIVRQWAVDGCGIAYKSALDVRADLAAGRLVRLLDGARGDDWPLAVVYPHRSSVSPAARALLDYVRSRLADY